MVATEIVQRKIAELAARIARIQQFQRPTADALAADTVAFELVAFNLMLAVQAACDLAAHVVADEGWLPTSTVAASFDRLAEHGVVTRATARTMGRAVGLRNVVAHGYAGLDPAMVHAASTTGLADLDAFAREVSAWLAARTS